MSVIRLTRYFALVMGVLFVLAGIGGFVPFVSPPVAPDAPELVLNVSYHYLLGLFPVNVVHNLVHLSLGIWGIAAFRRYESARLYCRWLAVILAVFTVMGILTPLSTMFGLMPLFGHDIWLHALEAVAAGYLGFIAREKT
jgi:hypothetical protein